MKKIFSFVMLVAAVAMVSCGNCNQKKAECCGDCQKEAPKTECCAECEKAAECPKAEAPAAEAAAPAEAAPAEAAPAEAAQ